MSDCDLCSTVFILRPQRAWPGGRFLGRAAHKLFLLMLGKAGQADLAAQLHDMNAVLPFTVSDLLPGGSEYYWLRVTGLDALPGQAFAIPARDGENDQPLAVSVEAAAMSQREWAGQTTYTGLVKEAWVKPARGRLSLDFMTPVTLKSVGVYRPSPDPALVHKGLKEPGVERQGQAYPIYSLICAPLY